MDRERQMEHLRAFIKKTDETGANPESDGLVVISTQVVEAGFDLSSIRLWSEIAPWPSIIQRLGRLNREGLQPEATAVFWMPKMDDSNNGDGNPNAKRVGPYEKNALNAARRLLDDVITKQAEGLEYRDALDVVFASTESQNAIQIEPEAVIRPDDFFELFSTEPDLAGGFTNISQFVRDQDRNADVYVFWRDFDSKTKQPNEAAPVRKELSPVPFFQFRQFVAKASAAWEWNFETGRWEPRRAADVQPGMTLLLPRAAGGYRSDVGWTGNAKDCEFGVLLGGGECDSMDADFFSGSQEWVSLSDHLADVEAEMREVLESIGLEGTPFAKALVAAARWHDWGKSIDRWQDAIRRYAAKACDRLQDTTVDAELPGIDRVFATWRDKLQSKDGVEELWAKFPDLRAACRDPELIVSGADQAMLSRKLKVRFRPWPTLRHEAASALAAWQSWLSKNDDLTGLAVYLIASHHGKVRTVMRSSLGSRNDVFGLDDGTALPPVPGLFSDPVRLSTQAKYVGASGEWREADTSFILTSPSWVQMVSELLGPEREGEAETSEVVPENEPRRLGPLQLAYLEALLRAADVRASRQPRNWGTL